MSARPDRDMNSDAVDHSAPNINTLWARILVDEFVRCGLRQAVIAPGSRSAPLVFQLAGRSEITDHSIIDERSAAFFALGMARSLGQPVALLCTSGTATANFYPAICEADADDVPLVVLTCNRPPEDHDCGAQQVMDQHRLYGNHVRLFHEVAPPAAEPRKLAYLRDTVCRTWLAALGPRSGPVHLDFPFDKPLEPVAASSDAPGHVPGGALAGNQPGLIGRPEGAPFLRLSNAAVAVDPSRLDRLIDRIDRSQRPVLLAGADHRGALHRESVRRFAAHAGIPLLAEAASGLRHWSGRGDGVIGSFELLASADGACGLDADLVLRIGHPPLTWAVQSWMARQSEAHHVQISRTDRMSDPDRLLSEQWVGDPAAVFDALTERAAAASDERRERMSRLQGIERITIETLIEALGQEAGLSAPRLWHEIGGLLPEGAALYFSSSMLVRHLETFMCGHDSSLDVHFNRGLNGIDGVVSTATGIAAARRFELGDRAPPTVLVIGDVALRHDLAALLTAIEQRLDLTVVVVDNGGGEIFEYLPSAAFGAIHEKHFATSGSLPIAEILPRAVQMSEPSDWDAFRRAFGESLDRPGLKLVRVATDRRADLRMRSRLMARVADALARAS